jgi:hypothetical protein
MAASSQRAPWFGAASCAIAAIVIVILVETTTYHVEGEFGAEHSSVGGGLTNDLDEWIWPVCGAVVAGIALGIAALRRPREAAWVARTGLALNAALLVLIAVFLAFAYAQGSVR